MTPKKSLKKKTITAMWLQVRDNVKVGTRSLYTTTFASVGAWCGAITDTGQSCSLTSNGEKVLEKILKGEELEVPPGTPSAPPSTQTTNLTGQVTPTLPTIRCPHCAKSEVGIQNEDLLNTVSSNGTNILIIKTTYYCRGCSRNFSTINQQLVKTSD